MSRGLHLSKTIPCRKNFTPQEQWSSSSQKWCFFVHESGFPLGLFQDYHRVSSPMKFLLTPLLWVPSHCTPANHYFKSPVSADAHEKGQCNEDWPDSSKPHTAAPRLQAHFKDPNTADQTKKSPVPWFLPQLNTHQKSSAPDKAVEVSWLQFHLHEHSNGRGMKRNSNLPDSSWASHEKINSFTMEEVLCFSGGRHQICPWQMPFSAILCFCWLKSNMALHLFPQP